MIYVQVPGIRKLLAGIEARPLARFNTAFPGILVCDGDLRFLNQYLLSGVLAISIFVDPVSPLPPVILRDSGLCC